VVGDGIGHLLVGVRIGFLHVGACIGNITLTLCLGLLDIACYFGWRLGFVASGQDESCDCKRAQCLEIHM
jgi:hypothetical protein